VSYPQTIKTSKKFIFFYHSLTILFVPCCFYTSVHQRMQRLQLHFVSQNRGRNQNTTCCAHTIHPLTNCCSVGQCLWLFPTNYVSHWLSHAFSTSSSSCQSRCHFEHCSVLTPSIMQNKWLPMGAVAQQEKTIVVLPIQAAMAQSPYVCL
jgi:hypothetical protein